MKLLIISLFALGFNSAHAAKGYQVTGPVTEITDSSITIKKGKETWQLAKTASTKGASGVKVGDKVTVYYSMTAEEIESKAKK